MVRPRASQRASRLNSDASTSLTTDQAKLFGRELPATLKAAILKKAESF